MTRFSLASLICLCMLTVGVGNAWGTELFNVTSYSSIPSGWTNNSVTTGSYFKFDANGAYLISPLYNAQNGVKLTCKVACFGSGTNHALTIQLLDENGTVKSSHTSTKPTSSSYVNDSWSIGDVGYKFKIKFYLSNTGKGVRLQVPKLTYANIETSTSSITGLDYVYGSGPSAAKSFTVTGSDLTGNLTVSAPTNFEVSTTSGSGYGSSVTLTASSGAVSATVYVRLASGKAVGSYGSASTYVTVSGGSAASKNVSVQGIVSSAGTSVTLSKAATTNGSFTLSNNGPLNTATAQTITVTGTPNTGYYLSGVTQSGASSTPTITKTSATTYTIQYPASCTGTSTITATFSPIWYLKGDFNSWDTSDPLTNITSNVATVTKSLSKTTGYEFKVYNAQEDAWYGNNGKIIDDVSGWTFSTSEGNCKVFATVADDYTFKFNISTKAMQVQYPSMTHPNDAYVYLTNWWDCYVHYWYTDGGGDHALIDWGYDTQLSRHEEICETDYWCVPILDGYPKLIMKDNAGDPSNTTGDQTTASNAGKYITHNGVSWGWHEFTTYTISYDKGTGTGGSMSNIEDIACGANQLLTANAFTKTGYNFDGWKADVDVKINGSTVSAGTKFNGGVTLQDIRNDIALTAQWVAKSCAVTFDKNGGTGGSDGTTATYGSAMTTITPPTRAGYTFDGYWDAETGNDGSGNKYYNANGTSAANWNRDTESATTLYAKWVAKTDTYKTGLHTGASGWTSYASGYTTGTSGAGYTIPTGAGNVTKGSGCEDSHYVFAGWVADEFKASPAGHIISASGTTDATGTTYWAVWGDGVPSTTYSRLTSIAGVDEDAQYVLGIDGTGFHYSGTSSWGLTALPANQTPLYYTLTKEDTATPTYFTAATTVSSYTYYLQVAGTGAFNMTTSSGTDAGKLVIGSTTNYGGDDKAYAVSVKGSTDKSLRRNGTSGIRCYNNTTTGSLVFFYKVVPSGDIDYVTSCCELKPATSVTVASTTGTSATLSWTAPSPTTGISKLQVRDASDDAVLVDNLLVSATGATVTGLTECDEYTFYVASVGATCYTASESVDAQPYSGAKTVTYKYHDDVTPDGSFTTDCSHTSTTLPNPSRTGYTLKGWYTAADGGTKKGDGGASYTPDATITLHAQWTEKTKYTITLNAGNGTVSADGWTAGVSPTWSKTQTNGDEEITLPSASCNCAGWEFQGWATSSVDQAGAPSMTSSGASVLPASNTTYYAVYRLNTPSGDDYTKITTTGELTTGYYVVTGLYNGTTPYAMKGELYNEGVSLAETSQTVSTNVATQSNAAFVWQILNFGSYVAFKNKDTGKFLAIVDGKFALQDDGQKFTYSVTSGAWTFTSPSGKQIIYASRFNVADAQDKAIHLFRQNPNLSGNYKTVPSCSDYTITGVANPAAGGSVQLTATAAKNGDKVWACYTADEDYNFTSWSVSGTGASLSSTSAQFTEITVGSANVTVTANFTAKVWRTVTWMLTGGDLGSASVKVEDGHKITTLPPAPTSCETGSGKSDVFMGWCNMDWSGYKDDTEHFQDGAVLYASASEMPTVSGDVTYYAVWAQAGTTPVSYTLDFEISESESSTTALTLSKLKTGLVNSSTNNTYYDVDNIVIGGYIAQDAGSSNQGGFRYGSGSNPGTLTMPLLAKGQVVVTSISVSAKKYSSDDTKLTLTAYFTDDTNQATTLPAGDGNYLAADYTTYTATYSSGKTLNKIAVSAPGGSQRMYLASVTVTANAMTKYLTKCCSAPTITISGTGKTVTDGKISFPVLREDLGGASSSTWAELPITISSNSSGEITIINGSMPEGGGNIDNAAKTAWKLSAWESRAESGGTITGTDHATFTNPSSGNYLFRVKTTTGYTGQGTYRIGITQAADATYCEATVYMWIDVTLRDKFIDVVNGNAEINKDGHGAQLKTPAESDMDADLNDDCNSTTRRLIGWIKETDLQTMYGSPGETGYLEDAASYNASKVVAPYADFTTSGCTWYAVWGVDNTPEP